LNVSINVEPSELIIGINVGRLSFDPSILQLNSITKGSLFDPYDTFTPGVINNTNGTVTGIGGSTLLSNATASPGDFCRISFTVQEKIGTSSIDLEDVIVTNISSVEIPVIIIDGEVAVVWSVTLDFNECSGKNDYVVFGEAATANDGQPHDSYDTPKAPVPNPPYIRAWFDDGLPTPPYPQLWKDYRHYSDTEKTWNLTVKWENNSFAYVPDITISWDTSDVDDSEYNSVELWNATAKVADMLTESSYTYTQGWFEFPHGSGTYYWLDASFQIFTAFEITNTVLTPSDPIDIIIGWENISCTVIDTGIGVKDVKLFVTYPDSSTVGHPMNKNGDTYSYNTTFTVAGDYTCYIWAIDTSDNIATSTPETFLLPENWDMNDDRVCTISDLRKVALEFGEEGQPGWIREDYNNDGTCTISDLRKVALCFGDTY